MNAKDRLLAVSTETDKTKYVTHPFLSVAVLEVVDALAVPLATQTEQTCRPEAVLRHDDEVHKETSARLHNKTNHTFSDDARNTALAYTAKTNHTAMC